MARRFTSKAQWRAMFARKMPFARRWAHRNQRSAPYKSLPRHHHGGDDAGRRPSPPRMTPPPTAIREM